jgi:Leucine-rich repeat (LRR) protein
MSLADQIIAEWIIDNNPDAILDLSSLELKVCPKIPLNCKVLDVSNNNLTELPDLPNCIILKCHNNNLEKLPPMPKCQRLICATNRLTELPDLPEVLVLGCVRNQLTKLPYMPKCQKLLCSGNNIVSIPEANYKMLVCSYTSVTQLPNLESCIALSCEGIPISRLPHLPLCETVRCGSEYLHINKREARRFKLQETTNYNLYAYKIQRKYKQMKHKKEILQVLNNNNISGLIAIYST